MHLLNINDHEMKNADISISVLVAKQKPESDPNHCVLFRHNQGRAAAIWQARNVKSKKVVKQIDLAETVLALGRYGRADFGRRPR